MSPPTALPPASSTSSAGTLVLAPEPSRTLLAWWLGLHALIGVAVLAVAAARPMAGVLLAGVLLHAVLRAPARPLVLVRHPDATWTVPERRLGELRPARGSCCTTFCVRLVLTGPHGRCHVLLVRDQLDEHDWRSLQACVRRSTSAPAD